MNRPANNFPKLHNAAWPGVVGKGQDSEPPIDLETMFRLTASAEYDGHRFDGVDVILLPPHWDPDAPVEEQVGRLAELAEQYKLQIGTVVPATWNGSAMDAGDGRKRFLDEVRQGCRVARDLRERGLRPNGCVRIDSASAVEKFLADPDGNLQVIAETFREACSIAADHGEKLAAEGEVCWGGMHTYPCMLDLLNRVNRPDVLGFQADMSHTLMYMLGVNGESGDRMLPPAPEWRWENQAFEVHYVRLAELFRPHTIDLHIAQNDGTIYGSGSHAKTGRHCLPFDPNGKLDIPRHAGYWLQQGGQPTRRFRHICWDGCMFPNHVMLNPQTWVDVLHVMVETRKLHGWAE